MAADPRWRIVRTFQTTGQDPAVVVQVVLPKPIWIKFVEAMDLAGKMTGSDKLGAQLDAVCVEACSEWLRQKP